MNGVEAASRDLFGKSVHDLTLAEGAMLAALPKAPSVYTPRRNASRALARRNVVLGLMADQGFVPRETAQKAAASRLRLAADDSRPSTSAEYSAIEAVRAVVDSV